MAAKSTTAKTYQWLVGPGFDVVDEMRSLLNQDVKRGLQLLAGLDLVTEGAASANLGEFIPSIELYRLDASDGPRTALYYQIRAKTRRHSDIVVILIATSDRFTLHEAESEAADRWNSFSEQ
ncbi:MAG: hypothetical protein HOH65_10665 [Rhodospirillaceae bacterium]|nr:hypothetical protein [Rhodospirillaceae bacterium]